MQESNFQSTLLKARDGDPAAFEEIFEHAADPLYYYCELRLGKKLRENLEPLDIVQESYMQALQSIADLDVDDWKGFLRWLYRVAENRIRRVHEYSQAAKRMPPGHRVSGSRALEHLRARVTGPVTAVARDEQKERLRAALEELPDEERRAVILNYFQEASVVEIARELDKAETTARRILSRGLELLGKALAPRD